MEGRKDERGTERGRDREVENVNYINISLRREKVDKRLQYYRCYKSTASRLT